MSGVFVHTALKPVRLFANRRNCEIRNEILTNELEEATKELTALDRRQQAVRKGWAYICHFAVIFSVLILVNALSLSASAHLLGERDAIEEKMRQLIEERELIDRHLSDQQEKQREVWQLYDNLL
jgi:hypothetical protein